MKILFLSPRLPLPADSGAKIRTLNLLKNIALDNEITLISFDFSPCEESLEEIKRLGIDTHVIEKEERFNPVSFFFSKPASIIKYYSSKMILKLKELTSTHKFDLAHFDHIHMGQYKDYTPGLPCILDEHNVECLILKRCARLESNAVKNLLFRSQAEKMSAFERNLAPKFTKCLTVSDSDKQQLYDLTNGKAHIEVIPNGVDTAYFKPNYEALQEQSVIFTGSMDWLPNNDAVVYFCREILPRVWAQNSAIKFYIVGRNPSGELSRIAAADKRITVTGAVKDVRPYIEKAGLYVVPIRTGGGTRLKILEAMSMGKAVVSTSIGAEGINHTDNKNIIICDGPREFAGLIIELLSNSEKRRFIGTAAAGFVRENYDWKIIAAKLKNIYAGLAGRSV